jgi:O-antigen/teichoic acid export membrane protein
MNNKTKINQLKGGVLLTYITMGVQLLVSLLYTPIMIRILGQSEYGLYNLAASVIAYLGILNFGFGSGYIRFYSRYKKKNDQEGIAKLNGMFLIIFLTLAFLAIIAGITLTYYADVVFGSELSLSEIKTARILMLILTFNLAFSFPASLFVSYIRANQRFLFQHTISLLKTITSPLVTLPILLLGYGSIGMVAVAMLLNLLIEVIYLIYARKSLIFRAKFSSFDFSLLKEMVIFSSFIFINIIIDQVNWNLDKFLIGRFHGTVAVAIYSLAALLNMQYLNISMAISSVFVPQVHQLSLEENSNKKLTDLFIKLGRIQFLIVSIVLLGFIFFGKPFIQWWAGNEYNDSYLIVLLLILPVTIPVIQNIGIEIQRAKNMHKFRSIAYLIIAVLNIGISIPLTMRYQGIGAAIGTAVALIIGNGIIMNIYYHRNVGLNILKFWKEILKIFPALIVPIVFGILYSYFVDIYHIGYFILGIIVFSLIYLFSMWFIGMNSYEKELIRKPIRKILKR